MNRSQSAEINGHLISSTGNPMRFDVGPTKVFNYSLGTPLQVAPVIGGNHV